VFWPRGPWIDGVYWTLPVEVAFYGLVLVLIYLGRLNWLERAAMCAGSASIVIILLGARLPVELTAIQFLKQGAFFAVGVILWKAVGGGWGRARALAFSVMVAGSLLRIQTDAAEKGSHGDVSTMIWVPAALWLLAVCAVGRAHSLSLFTSASIAKIVSTAGLATYPLYLLHAVVGTALIRFLIIKIGIGENAALVAAMIAMVASATIITLTLERWLRTSISRLGWPSSVQSRHAG
jgi:peptidoglycan/LPS O-acetylase OafA/YrhL